MQDAALPKVLPTHASMLPVLGCVTLSDALDERMSSARIQCPRSRHFLLGLEDFHHVQSVDRAFLRRFQ